MPHIIRLNRVWELRLLAAVPTDFAAVDESVAQADVHARIDLPWKLAQDEIGVNTVLLSRRFNRPSNLAAGQAVHLAMEPADIGGPLFFNGELLEAPEPAADAKTVFYPVDDLLQENNRLDLVAPLIERLTHASVRLIIDEMPAT